MKKVSWILPVLMLLVAAENLYWDTFYGNFATVCYPVMGVLILLSALLGIRLQKTAKRRFLVLMILIFAFYLWIAVFRHNVQEIYNLIMKPIGPTGGLNRECWTEPMQMDWN